MDEKTLPQKIIDQLQAELKEIKFIYLPNKKYWYGIIKKKHQGIRLYIIKNKNGEEVPRIEIRKLHETGQLSAGVWVAGLKSLFKKKDKK